MELATGIAYKSLAKINDAPSPMLGRLRSMVVKHPCQNYPSTRLKLLDEDSGCKPGGQLVKSIALVN